MKRILVTGGAGFVGSNLCERLLRDGHEVLCLDNFYTGQKENILHMMNDAFFEVIRHDVNFPFYAEVDEIYNLACPASPPHYQKYPVETTKTCVQGMINMLELAKRTGAKILQASTSEIYGDPECTPQQEEYNGNVNPIGTRACYDEGKRCAETLCFDYYREYGVKVRVVRIFNTYGPNMAKDDGRVVSNFIVQTLEGRPITIYGNGEQTRSFCYVDDLIDGLILTMEQHQSLVVNLGNPHEVTVNELAGRIQAITGRDNGIEYKPLPQDDPCRRKPNIERAERFGFKPRIGLTTGLTKTVNYFSERYVL